MSDMQPTNATGSPGIRFSWTISSRCNYRCEYCFSSDHWEDYAKGDRVFSVTQWQRAWGRIYQKHGECFIEASGGEPFIYPNFTDILKLLAQQHRFGISTNLSWDVRLASELNPERVLLYPSFHPTQADSEEFIQKLLVLKKLGFQADATIVAYPQFFAKLEGWREKFGESGCRLDFLPFQGSHESNKYPQSYTPEQKRFLGMVIDESVRKRYQLEAESPYGKLCEAGCRYARIIPDGNVARCSQNVRGMDRPDILGNFLDGNFHLSDRAFPCQSERCVCSNEIVYLMKDNSPAAEDKPRTEKGSSPAEAVSLPDEVVSLPDEGTSAKVQIPAKKETISKTELAVKEGVAANRGVPISANQHPLSPSDVPFYPDSYLALEITDHCNLQCTFCPQSHGNQVHDTEKGYMPFELFRKAIDDCVAGGMKFGLFMPFWLGEPLLHREFRKMFDYYLKHRQHISNCWQIDTNATLLDDELTEFLLKQNDDFPSRIHFSLDAVHSSTYQKLRGADMNSVVRNVKHLMQRKKELGLDYPECVLQFIVTEENFQEAAAFQDHWHRFFRQQGIGGRIFFKRLDAKPETTRKTDPLFQYVNAVACQKSPVPHKRYVEHKGYTNPTDICAAPWKTLLINHNGDVTVCCVDNRMTLKVGNIRTDSLYSIWWNNPRIEKIRQSLMRKEPQGMCSDCHMVESPNWLRITEEELQDYRAKVSRKQTSSGASFLHRFWLRENWWLTLELSGKCNLACPNCSQQVQDVQGEHMDPALLKKLMKEFRETGLQFHSITPFYRGESLCHPQFTEMLECMTENHDLFGFYTLHTNGTCLTRKVSDALLDAYSQMPYGELYFSIDAATEKTYNKVRCGGDFHKTIENIQYFVEEKVRRNQKYPFLVFQFIVQEQNMHEAGQFLEFWSQFLTEKGMSFTVNRDEDRLLDVHKYQDNIIYFRRLETTPQEQERNRQLQQRVYQELKLRTE